MRDLGERLNPHAPASANITARLEGWKKKKRTLEATKNISIQSARWKTSIVTRGETIEKRIARRQDAFLRAIHELATMTAELFRGRSNNLMMSTHGLDHEKHVTGF